MNIWQEVPKYLLGTAEWTFGHHTFRVDWVWVSEFLDLPKSPNQFDPNLMIFIQEQITKAYDTVSYKTR